MHLLTLNDKNAYNLPADTYVADDINAAESLARGEGVVNQAHLNLRPFVPEEDWNGRRILFCRGGGIGDLMFCTPTIREIKKRWPDCIITFACFKHFMPILEKNSDIDHLVSHPMILDEFTKFDAYFYLEQMHDSNADTHQTPAVDLILQMAKLDSENKELRYDITFEEKAAAWTSFPKTDRKRIGIQLSASSPSRTWPRSHVSQFTKLAIQEGFEVVWFGYPGESGDGKIALPEHLIDLTRRNPALTLRESMAVLDTVDGFVGMDSAFTHVCGALGKPCVGLYGAFPSKLRVSYAKSVKGIDGPAGRKNTDGSPCSPCFHHYRGGGYRFPVDGPCNFTGRCEVLASLDPESILKKIIRHMRKLTYRNGESQ